MLTGCTQAETAEKGTVGRVLQIDAVTARRQSGQDAVLHAAAAASTIFKAKTIRMEAYCAYEVAIVRADTVHAQAIAEANAIHAEAIAEAKDVLGKATAESDNMLAEASTVLVRATKPVLLSSPPPPPPGTWTLGLTLHHGRILCLTAIRNSTLSATYCFPRDRSS